MLCADYLTGNPITGRQAWIVRHINGKWGDPWDWRVDVVKPYHFSRTAILLGGEGAIANRKSVKSLQKLLRHMGFKRAKALRNGRWKHYKIP